MIITDLMKLNKIVETNKAYISSTCSTLYEDINHIVKNFPYSDSDSKFLLDNWLKSESELGMILSFNPSTIGNKKGKMTKEIEQVVPRRFIKRLLKANDKVIICRINKEELDDEICDELDDLDNIVSISNYRVEDEFPSFLKDIYKEYKFDKNANEKDFTLVELRPILDKIANYSNSIIYKDLLQDSDVEKLSYILNVMYSNNFNKENISERSNILSSLRDIVEANLDGLEDGDEIISESYS